MSYASGAELGQGAQIAAITQHPRLSPWLTGRKARGLVEAVDLGLPIAPAIAVRVSGTLEGPELGSAGRERLATALNWLEGQIGAQLGERRTRHHLLAVRCEDKSVHPELPASLINLGLVDRGGAGDAQLRRERDDEFSRAVASIPAGTATDLGKRTPREQVELAFAVLAGRLLRLGLEDTGYLILQEMRFASLTPRSAVGSAYTRHPYTGALTDYGKYVRSEPGPRAARRKLSEKRDLSELKNEIPEAYEELRAIFRTLELFYRDVRYVEYVVEEGSVWLMQNTIGNRTPGIFELQGIRELRSADD